MPASRRCCIGRWWHAGSSRGPIIGCCSICRLGRTLDFLNRRLGEADYLAGSELTAADIMIVFSLTTMRTFTSCDLKAYPHILAYLRRIGAREAYRRAMRKGDPGMTPMLD